jgi:NAD(P)-dependent dehydrogenase (short-subunit alcohol dehydrogenase family)
VNVSSAAHHFGKMDFKNLLFNNGKNYSPIRAYARSKLANLLFTYELQRQFIAHKIDCLAVAAHPGASQTELGRHIEDAVFFKVFNPVLKSLVQGPDKGALPQLRAATDLNVKGSEYYGPNGAFEMSGYPIKVPSSRKAKNLADAKRLWQQSEQLTGVVYSFS